MEMRSSDLVKISAIASITILDGLALTVGHIDGVVLSMVVAVVAGLAGYEVGRSAR